MTEPYKVDQSALLSLTADIVVAHVGANQVAPADLPLLISSVHDALAGLGVTPEEQTPTPAVPVRASVKPDYLVCLEDGRKFKTLKRHLMTSYGLTPDQYRAKWNLPADYPMVAPAYAARRSALAKASGLGRKRTEFPTTSDGAQHDGEPSPVATGRASGANTTPRRKRGRLSISV